MKKLLLAGAALGAMVAVTGATPAQAALILTFGQTSSGNTITGTANGPQTATTISGSDIAVTITQYQGGGTPISAYFNLSATSSGVAALVVGNVLQSFSGNFSFTSGLGGTGTNYLSSTGFIDFVFGAGGSLTLSSAEPPGTLPFTSSVLGANELLTPRAIAFGFAGVTPGAAICGTTLCSFTSSVAGTASAAVEVPEPMSMALLGAGLLGLGFARRRKA